MGKWSERGLAVENTEQQEPEKKKWSERGLGIGPGMQAVESPIPGEEGTMRRLQTEYEEIQGPRQPSPLIPPEYSFRTPVQAPKETKRASFGALQQAGWVDDPQLKIKILAEDMGIPEDRFGVHQGEIVYLGKDNVLYYPTAQTPGGKLKRAAAETVSSLPEIGLSTVGSLYGPGGTVAGAIAGTAIKKGVGKLVYGEQEPKLKTLKDLTISAGTAYAGHKIGELTIKGVDRLKGSKGARLLRTAGRDRFRMSRQEIIDLQNLAEKHGIELFAPQATGSHELIARFNLLGDMPVTADKIGKARLYQFKQVNDAINNYLKRFGPETVTAESAGEKGAEAAQKGIKSSMAIRKAKAGPLYKKAFEKREVIDVDKLKGELSYNESLIAKGKPREVPDPQEIVRRIRQKSSVPTMQIKGESEADWIKRISSDYRRVVGGNVPTKTTEGAQDIAALKRRNAEIKSVLKGETPEGVNIPKKTFTVDISDAEAEVKRLMGETVKGDPSYKALKLIKTMFDEAAGDPRKLDRVKRSGIDNVLNKTKTSRTLARELKIVKDKLTSAMDKQIPEYAQARKIYSEESEFVDKLMSKKGKVGKLAALEGDDVAKASKMVFSPSNSSPEIINRVKPVIIKQGGQEAWDNLIKVHLKQNFRDVVKTNTTNIGGMFRKKVWTDLNQHEILQAAMTPDQRKNLESFMKVLEAVGKTAGRESTTAPRLVSIADMEAQAQGLKGKIARAAAYPLYTWQRIIVDWRAKLRSEKYFNKLADAMISEESVPQIKEMLQLKPGSQKLLKAFSVFVATATGAELQNIRGRAKMKDVFPARLRQLSTIRGTRQ